MSSFIKNMQESQSLVESPVGDLEWVVISGQGKLNKLKKAYEYVATLVMDAEDAQPFIDEINEFFDTHKIKKFAKKAPKTLSYRPHTIPTDEVDEETGAKVYKETGKIAFSFKTQTTFKDGNTKKIPVFNSKGREVELGNRQIGNGSRGKIKGVIRYYEADTDHGVSLYINGLQLAKYVEYKGGTTFDELDEEDGFDGFEGDSTPLEEADDAKQEETAAPSRGKNGKSKPRL